MKKTRWLLLSAVIVVFCVSTVAADGGQEQEEEVEEFNHGIGIAAGFVTGYGLSYRYLGENFNLQFTFAPYVAGDDVAISVGVALLKNLYVGRTSKLFLYSGVHYWYHRYKNSADIDMKDSVATEETDQLLNFGIGPGLELKITNNIVFDLMAGYALYLQEDESTMLSFTGELALFFYFE